MSTEVMERFTQVRAELQARRALYKDGTWERRGAQLGVDIEGLALHCATRLSPSLEYHNGTYYTDEGAVPYWAILAAVRRILANECDSDWTNVAGDEASIWHVTSARSSRFEGDRLDNLTKVVTASATFRALLTREAPG